MKKLISIAILCFLVTGTVLPFTALAAGSGSVSLNGPGTVRAGDTITVTLDLNSSNITAGGADVNYNASQLTLQSATAATNIGWSITFNNSSGKVSFGGFNSSLAAWSGSKTMITMVFKVGDVAAGTNISVSTANVKMSDGSSDGTLANAAYSKAIAAPISGNTKLATLTVSNAAISPTFSAGQKNYTADVGFDITKLTVAATAEDAKSNVSVNSPNLTPGGKTNVTITVTAESGAKDTYTISVIRAQDPDYAVKNNTNLKTLAVSNATISPAFSVGTKSYTANVGFDVTKLNVTATADEPRSNVSISNPELVAAGNTNVTITVTAESGTKSTYTIVVTRAQDPNFKGSSDNKISSITVDGFLISPPFSADVKSYLVWLPYETAALSVSAVPSDSKATVTVEGGENLKAGQDNEIKLTCHAEDGTAETYIVIAKRAAAHDGSIDEPNQPTNTESADDNTNQGKTDTPAQGSPWWLTVVIGIVCLGAGAGICFFIFKKSKRDN